MKLKDSYQYVIIGSGFGGAFAALKLAEAGREVLIVERGISVKRDDTCWDEIKLHLENPLYRGKTPVLINQKKDTFQEDWPDDTVGGMSTFYGAAAFRLREDDFDGPPVPDSGLRDKNLGWPLKYSDISGYYDYAEKLQGIAGRRGTDITEPPAAEAYPHETPEELASPCMKIEKAAIELGLNPFHLPMAINFSGNHGKEKCILCPTCDHYLCKIEAKNDLDVTVLPLAVKNGAEILENTRVLGINHKGKMVTSVDLIDQSTGEQFQVKAENVILSAGALSSPHLLLSSGIDQNSPGGNNIGRYLIRHANGIVAGLFPGRTNIEQKLQKRLAIPDFYYGSIDGSGNPPGPWGIIQDVSSIGKGVIKANAPFGLKNIAALFSSFLINQLCIAEDIPQSLNRVTADNSFKDIYGSPALKIYHRYHPRDIQARNALYKQAKRILRKAGALGFYTMPIETFSHALGTCRMGVSPDNSVVDPECRVWGMKNLYISDGSILPSGGSVNPSLTIAAMSLRLADILL